uniref:Putative lectin/glucanase superfamily protein n=1 Tax=viral metagenome TaxID=1070528 RepID=A0A6M3J5X6_9ZZZZ
MLLNKNSEPAERARGCVFSERFVNAADVVENGGSITGTPVINQGATLDGTGDKITYLTQYGVKSIVFQIKLDSTTEDILKLSSSHSIAASGGTLTATGLSSPTYYIGGSATQTIGTSWVWVAISTATAFNADDIQLGYISGYGGFEIKNLKFFTAELTAQEKLDYSNGGGFWNYQNEADLNVPGDLANHDATNGKALNVGRNGNDGTISGAVKSTIYPGYNLDGNNDYIQVALSGSQTSFSSSAWFRKGADDGTESLFQMYQSDNSTDAIRVHLYSGTWRINHDSGGTTINTSVPVNYGGLYHMVATVDSSNICNLFVNGELVYTSVALTIPSYGTKFTFGRDSLSILATVWGMEVWEDKVLTPMQIADLYLRELRQINQL